MTTEIMMKIKNGFAGFQQAVECGEKINLT
jgi:hypothetical protein